MQMTNLNPKITITRTNKKNENQRFVFLFVDSRFFRWFSLFFAHVDVDGGA